MHLQGINVDKRKAQNCVHGASTISDILQRSWCFWFCYYTISAPSIIEGMHYNVSEILIIMFSHSRQVPMFFAHVFYLQASLRKISISTIESKISIPTAYKQNNDGGIGEWYSRFSELMINYSLNNTLIFTSFFVDVIKQKLGLGRLTNSITALSR